MNRLKRVNLALALLLLAAVTGCVGFVDGGGVAVGGPDVFIGGGFYDRGRDMHGYSDRGHASRGFAHSGGGHGRGH